MKNFVMDKIFILSLMPRRARPFPSRRKERAERFARGGISPLGDENLISLNRRQSVKTQGFQFGGKFQIFYNISAVTLTPYFKMSRDMYENETHTRGRRFL